MAQVSVKPDQTIGCRFRQDGSGLNFVRKFIIWDADTLPQGSPADTVLTAALTAPTEPTGLKGLLPRYGDLFPGNGMTVNLIEAMPYTDKSRTGVSVTVTYGPPQDNIFAWNIEISGSNAIRDIERWSVDNLPPNADPTLVGSPILIPIAPQTPTDTFSYPFDPDDVELPPDAIDPTYCDYASVPMLSPNTIIQFTKAFKGSDLPGGGPIAFSQMYRRKVNDHQFLLGDTGTWLCRDVTSKWIAVPPQGGSTTASSAQDPNAVFLMSFLFEWQPEGWSKVEYFRSFIDGRIPTDIDPTDGTNNGYINFVPYGSVHFQDLDFPNIF